MDAREQKAQTIVARGGVSAAHGGYRVLSQSGTGAYRVTLGAPSTCSCEDHYLHHGECKHLIAAKLWREWQATNPINALRPKLEEPEPPKRKTYKQDWPNYNLAQNREKDHLQDLLADLCGCDRGPEDDPRFEVNYHLFSTVHYMRLRLKVLLTEDEPNVPTVTTLWQTANWHERETYDLFGIKFDGHPDLRRILLPSDFDGHALRKDYPLRGYEPYSLN